MSVTLSYRVGRVAASAQASVAPFQPPVRLARATLFLSTKAVPLAVICVVSVPLVPGLVMPSATSHIAPLRSAMPEFWPLCVVRANRLAEPVSGLLAAPESPAVT